MDAIYEQWEFVKMLGQQQQSFEDDQFKGKFGGLMIEQSQLDDI